MTEKYNYCDFEMMAACRAVEAQPEQEPQVCCGEYDTCLRACTPRGRHLAKPEQEPVAHCEAGPEYCQQCKLEDRSIVLAAAVRYVKNNTPQLVSDEICMALASLPAQRKPLTINEVEQILAQHNYEIHGDRARYIVRMTEAAHGIKENA